MRRNAIVTDKHIGRFLSPCLSTLCTIYFSLWILFIHAKLSKIWTYSFSYGIFEQSIEGSNDRSLSHNLHQWNARKRIYQHFANLSTEMLWSGQTKVYQILILYAKEIITTILRGIVFNHLRWFTSSSEIQHLPITGWKSHWWDCLLALSARNVQCLILSSFQFTHTSFPSFLL